MSIPKGIFLPGEKTAVFYNGVYLGLIPHNPPASRAGPDKIGDCPCFELIRFPDATGSGYKIKQAVIA